MFSISHRQTRHYCIFLMQKKQDFPKFKCKFSLSPISIEARINHHTSLFCSSQICSYIYLTFWMAHLHIGPCRKVRGGARTGLGLSWCHLCSVNHTCIDFRRGKQLVIGPTGAGHAALITRECVLGAIAEIKRMTSRAKPIGSPKQERICVYMCLAAVL